MKTSSFSDRRFPRRPAAFPETVRASGA